MRPPLPEVPYDEPTDEERRLGSWFSCRGCDRPWPLRLADVRERYHCANCGRKRRRARQADTRARAKAGTLERPVEIPQPASRPADEAKRTVDLSDPSFHADLYAGRVPEEVSRELDQMIEQAARRRR